MASVSPAMNRQSEQRRDKIDYCIIYAVAFVIFLAAALVQHCLPRRLRSHPCDPQGRKSILEEARCATRVMMPFAFMG